jgi:hypothetical protein
MFSFFKKRRPVEAPLPPEREPVVAAPDAPAVETPG